LFCTARWKAYLESVKERGKGDNGEQHIYDIYHSQSMWFTRDDPNGHNKTAGEHLQKCDELLKDCTMMVDNLEETLRNTPKPSEILDWGRLW
jgi:hypothetical protein